MPTQTFEQWLEANYGESSHPGWYEDKDNYPLYNLEMLKKKYEELNENLRLKYEIISLKKLLLEK